MLEFLIYDLKAACLIAIFYMFYRLLLANETMHRLNRIVLLLTALLSFVLPLCVLTFHRVVTVAPATGIEVGAPEMSAIIQEESNPWWVLPLAVVFITGAILTLGYSLLSIIQVMRFISKSEKHPQDDGTTIVVTDKDTAPFSWMHYIVLSRTDYASSDAAILAHERGHIRHHHSWDVLFTYIVTPLQWFNPAIWMLRSDLRSIHEYEADKEVLSQGINARQYQLLLVTKAMAAGGYPVVNSLSHSTLKKRINMMLKKKSSAMRSIKVLFALPIIAASLALNAKTETTYLSAISLATDDKEQPSSTISTLDPQIAAVLEASDDDYIYIVDGKHMTDISGISSAEIESMTVLRGESARQLGYSRNVVIVKLKKNGEAPETKTNDDKIVFDVCEQMPEFPGGVSELMGFLSKTIKYPETAIKSGKQGRVIVSFIITEKGEVREASILQGVEESLDMEALRVVGEMPNWTPGMQAGKPVRVRYSLPINFKLNSDTAPKESKPEAVSSEKSDFKISGTYTSLDNKAEDNPDNAKIAIRTSGKFEGKITYIIDDVEKTEKDFTALPPSSIDHIDVDKSDGNGIIKIYTKK